MHYRSGAAGTWTLVIGTLSLFATGAAFAEERTFDKTFPATPGGMLLVDSDTGSINVRGTDGNEVTVHAVLSGGRGPVEKFRIEANPGAKGIEIRGKRHSPGWWLFEGGLNVKYTITVPRDYHLDVRTSGGDLELNNINGQTVARTSGGDVHLNSMNGDAEIRTSGGNIRTMQFIGNARFSTSGGNVNLDGSSGEFTARTSGGNIRMNAVNSKLAAETSGGDVDVSFSGDYRGADLRTSGGDITVRVPAEVKASVDARTSGGEVECDLPVTVVGSHKDSALQGTINGGGQTLLARTSGGDIRIQRADR